MKSFSLKYNSWKYSNSQMLYAISLAICVACDMYLEVTEGQLNNDWKIGFPVDFWKFCDVIPFHMLEYDLKNWK